MSTIPPQRNSSMTRNAEKRANHDAASTMTIQTRFAGWNSSVWTTYAVNTPASVANANAAFETRLPHGSARAAMSNIPLKAITCSRTPRKLGASSL